ncbi:hypothetical protein BH09ACT6_BH09ACT6_17090 [soil metagenome]
MSRRKKQLWVSLVATVTVFSVGLAFAVATFAFPKTDLPQKTDVVLVLGPATGDRIALAESMMDEGLSKNLMVSVGASKYANDPSHVCSKKVSYTVYCAVPSPFTTQGEAEWLQRMTREHGWTSATVITFRPHVNRARTIIGRCFSGDLDMVAVTTPLSPLDWAYQFVYQSAALIKVALTPDC